MNRYKRCNLYFYFIENNVVTERVLVSPESEILNLYLFKDIEEVEILQSEIYRVSHKKLHSFSKKITLILEKKLHSFSKKITLILKKNYTHSRKKLHSFSKKITLILKKNFIKIWINSCQLIIGCFKKLRKNVFISTYQIIIF